MRSEDFSYSASMRNDIERTMRRKVFGKILKNQILNEDKVDRISKQNFQVSINFSDYTRGCIGNHFDNLIEFKTGWINKKVSKQVYIKIRSQLC